jgi:predicted transcriptional regulator
VNSRRTPPPLHELEAEVMAEVWRHDRDVTVREVADRLNERSSRERAYNTILTIMTRLERKGLLRRRRAGRNHEYGAVFDADAYRDARAAAGVSALVEEFGDVALVHFARRVEDLDDERREELRRLARGDAE